MQPPYWVLRKIEGMHKIARLGYSGGDTFDILELWRVREAPTTIIGTPYGGHVYGSDYDHLGYVPLKVAETTIESVFDGSVIEMVKHMLSSYKERTLAARRQQGEEIEREIKNLAGEMGEEIYHIGKRAPDRGVFVPNEFITPQEKAIATGDLSSAPSFTDMFMPQPGVGGAIK